MTEAEHEVDNLVYDENTPLLDEEETDVGGDDSFKFGHFNRTIEGGARSKVGSFVDQQKLDEGLKKLENIDEAWKKINAKVPNTDKLNNIFEAYIDEDGRVIVKLKRGNAKSHIFFDRDGNVNKKLPNKILQVLGPTKEEIKKVEENNKKISTNLRRNEELELQNSDPNTSEEVRNENLNEMNENLNENDELEQESEAINSKMSTTNRIKEIFKEHGVTVFSILTATGVIIGVIVSNLSSGLASVAKGLGNGLKALGKKLAQILPGMIGAIASFLFKTAGEALGFLAKNSWLLILFAVTYAVEKFTKKNK